MAPYFAMLWDIQSEAQALEVCSLRRKLSLAFCGKEPTFASPGIEFFDLSHQPDRRNITLLGSEGANSGLIFGRLFSNSRIRSVAGHIRALEATDVAKTFETGGLHLIQNFWGSYVSFMRTDQGMLILSDPTGGVPCFYAHSNGVLLGFSHLEACRFLDPRRFTINEPFIQRLLAYDKIQNGETGLNEVRELCGGQRLSICSDSIRLDRLWDPLTIARSVYSPSADYAGEELLETVDKVVGSWAGCFENITVSLSGGLDSSIVLSSIASVMPSKDIRSLHVLMDSDDRSEVEYANAMARFTKTRLTVGRLSPYRDFPEANTHPLTVRPWRQFLAFDYDDLIRDSDAPVGRVIFTGQGGDHLFLETRSPLGFVDHLRQCGLRNKPWTALKEAAAVSGLSYPDVILKSLPRLMGLRHQNYAVRSMRARQTRINQNAAIGIDLMSGLPEWARDTSRLPPAKSDQISLLPHMHHVRDPMLLPKGRIRIHPLIWSASRKVVRYLS